MVKRSEGVRRIVLLVSIVATLGWALFVVITTEGFSVKLDPIEWGIIMAGFLVAYFAAPTTSRIVYWIIDGFSKDKNA